MQAAGGFESDPVLYSGGVCRLLLWTLSLHTPAKYVLYLRGGATGGGAIRGE